MEVDWFARQKAKREGYSVDGLHTILHESSHRAWANYLTDDQRKAWEEYHKRCRVWPTPYAKTNEQENFCETLAVAGGDDSEKAKLFREVLTHVFGDLSDAPVTKAPKAEKATEKKKPGPYWPVTKREVLSTKPLIPREYP